MGESGDKLYKFSNLLSRVQQEVDTKFCSVFTFLLLLKSSRQDTMGR
jgi:hypothetical protein